MKPYPIELRERIIRIYAEGNTSIKLFCISFHRRQLPPTTTQMVDTRIATALGLVNPEHLCNGLANCCDCAS